MLIDAHTRLDRYEEPALEAALAEIEEHHILTIGSAEDIRSYRRTVEIAERCKWVLPTFGAHPWNAVRFTARHINLQPTLDECPMIGEIGLDHHWVEDWPAYSAQRALLDRQLAAAREQDKVIHLHVAKAEGETLDMLARHKMRRVVVHWRMGSPDAFHQMVARGYWFTMGVGLLPSGNLKPSAAQQDLLRELPMDQLLTETNNPGVWKFTKGGKPRMPLHIREVIQAIAEIKGMTPHEVEQAVQDNFRRLIRDDKWVWERWGTLLED